MNKIKALMLVYVNNKPFYVDEAVTITEALEQFGAVLPYAVLLNDSFVPRSNQGDITLSQKDSLEVISAIQGG